ncbi:MAG: efflux RND transporter periplasmic adaptor subunit [Candidatus Hydrogenedentes bacterium]|nr:efflux RND transporter periplasmic adaptor subunit [Candidatus Hydrogenedentota bacterium]
MKRAITNILVIAAIIAGGAGIAMVGMTLRSRPSDAGIVTEKKPLNVKVQILESRTVEDELVLMGTVEPWEAIILSAKTMGEIEWQGVEEGQFVEAGQELMRIDIAPTLVSLAQAQAQYKLSVRELERFDRMREEGISSPQDRDRALLDFEVAWTNMRASEIKLEDGRVNAKFRGVIDMLYQEEGEYVNTGADLIRLVQLHKVKLVVGLPERDVAHFAKGDPVSVQLDAFPGETLSGTVFLIAATAEQSTHTFATEIALENPRGNLKPGMIAEARFVRQSFPNSIMVPLFSLISTDTGRHTFIDDNGEARIRPVETGFFRRNLVHITEGLEDGDRLIVVGQRDLRDGDPIAVREIIQ